MFVQQEGCVKVQLWCFADSDPLESEKLTNLTGVKKQYAKVSEDSRVKPSGQAMEKHGANAE